MKKSIAENQAAGQLSYLDENKNLSELATKSLLNPFDPSAIIWKPTATKEKNGKKTCTALAHAQTRAYEERLDEVFGPANWGRLIKEITVFPYKKIIPEKRKVWNDPSSEVVSPERIIDGHKIAVTVQVCVNGLVPKEATAVTETDDENSIMTAEAQAFKRACSQMGLGRYLYHLPRYENVEMSYNKIKNPPSLPAWAIPATFCADCASAITSAQFTDPKGNVVSWDVLEVIKRSRANFDNTALCLPCMKKRREAKVPPAVDKKLSDKDAAGQQAA